MIKFKTAFIVSILSLTNLGCTYNTNLNQSNEYSINNFSLEQLKENGEIHFKMSSKQAFIHPISRNIQAKSIDVVIFSNNLPILSIYSNRGYFNNKKNLITLFDQIEIRDINNKITKLHLKAENLSWDLGIQKFNITGNIDLYYNNSKLTSKSIVYDEKSQKFMINGIKQYKYYLDLNKEPILILESEMAILDINSNNITFSSKTNRVKSLVNLN